MARRRPSPQALITFAVAACLTLALLPSRYTGWTSVFRDPVLAIVAPVSGPTAALAGVLRRGENTTPAMEPDDLMRQRDFYRDQYYRALSRVESLESQVTSLQSGVAPLRGPSIRLLHATRIGADLAGGTIQVRQGRRAGVVPDLTVATARQSPQHLVGIVTEAGPAISTILLATDPRVRVGQHSLIRARILPDDAVTQESFFDAVECDLRAAGDGTFMSEPVDASRDVSEGDLVYLSDDNWPASAQMLVLGRVQRVTPRENTLFVDVVVRPDFDLSRVRQVVLRTSADDGAAEGGQ